MATPNEEPAAELRDSPQVRALIDSAKAGDTLAFGELVGLNQRVAFRTALAALGDRADAEDVAQEALVVAWQKLPAFRGDSSFRTWLLTIVWRRALDRRRARRRWFGLREPVPAAPALDPLDHVAEPSADPERIAMASDLVAHVQRQISALSPKLRDTLLLASSGEYSYDEIARMLKIPIGTLKWRVAEARRLVQLRLAEDDATSKGARS
jgi:RNA polymerase sigma-70 factor (ECF subfamily)